LGTSVFKNILVPTDGSKLSQKAIRQAIAPIT
jgi:nucleotide-binding universal stress UspA family protein